MDVNKENKYPGSPAKHDAQNLMDKVSDLPSDLPDTDLEEGEILSESDEASANSPVPSNKRARLAQPAKNKPTPRTLANRSSKERCAAPKETSEAPEMSTPSPKSRFKTVCAATSKSYFSTIEEVMETFRLVRAQIRKKYMKLHKTFPKKSFYGVMDNFRESFLKFVDGATFGQISSQQGELKSKLKKLIVSVFNKVSNNGIVNRIFEQQAVDLKQKLWDFVDVQVEYLFTDINTTMKSLWKPARVHTEDKMPSRKEKAPKPLPVMKPQCQQPEAQPAPSKPNRVKNCTVVPYKTGLGSRGKDIRITNVEKNRNVNAHPTGSLNTQTVVDFHPPKNVPSTPEKTNISSVVSQNGSLLDKTDFELLTEQQASSLTFNLVRDTQMGEIFKCLLQGSDLLETSGATGDNTAWSLGTPRKDGERYISITTPTKFDFPSKLLSPSKYETPSKLIATWSSISPRKVSSPQSKLNPALLDESCLLEVPSESRPMLQSGLTSERSFSILAEDLAVSLTIPSPLKSDGHLSFLQPSGTRAMSTPDSVISAHISEDALLDGEDATEQDIHLALDTDNSSCGSSSSVASETLATPFLFKPDLRMEALVMERSNDHFILKIRQATAGADTTLTADDGLNQTLTKEDEQHRGDCVTTQEREFSSVKSPNVTPSNAAPSAKKPASAIAAISLSQGESSTMTENSPRKTEVKSLQQNTSEDSQKLHRLRNPTKTTTLCDIQSTNKVSGQLCQATSSEKTTVSSDESTSQTCHREDQTTQQSPSNAPLSEANKSPRPEIFETNQRSRVQASSDSRICRTEDSKKGLTNAKKDTSSTPEKNPRHCDKSNKRKRHQKNSKAKRPRQEQEASPEKCKNDNGECMSSPTSSNSLHAKNVIKKKGEVVMSWTRSVGGGFFCIKPFNTESLIFKLILFCSQRLLLKGRHKVLGASLYVQLV